MIGQDRLLGDPIHQATAFGGGVLTNITELEFIQLSHKYKYMTRTSPISGKENVVIVYYLLSNGSKSKITISGLLFPNFKSISDKILVNRPKIKVTFKNKKQSNY